MARWFSKFCAVLGAVVMLATAVLCIGWRDARPQVLRFPQEAADCARSVMDALAAGDYAAAQARIYGQPDLGVYEIPSSQHSALVLEAFRQRVDYSFQGECAYTDAGFSQQVTVRTLDLDAVADGIPATAHALLTARVEAARDMTELYDENNEFRQDLVEQVLLEAVEQVLAQAGTVERQGTIRLVYQDGQWWALPDEDLIQALCAVTGG